MKMVTETYFRRPYLDTGLTAIKTVTRSARDLINIGIVVESPSVLILESTVE